MKRGAEAIVSSVFFDGIDSVLKERVRKNYRVEELDKKLRSQRTRSEARITGEARRAGVKTAAIYSTDEKNFRIYFELLDGVLLKNVFNSSDERKMEIAKKWGLSVAKLHAAGIIHGDLTTSNMIVMNDELYFIDFGLAFFSKREEDKAEDINLLRQSIEATHSEFAELIWKHFLAGYSTYSNNTNTVKRAAEIGSRGRYSKRTFPKSSIKRE
ncbi:MAG: Kae1-associated serine/threonine protein kinase [Candidatus Aenigmarchaeota archaeon]|nr:Kae1-associated serine/threonine protein kinase [Candidatus Aenigmarchaeota archaeon]